MLQSRSYSQVKTERALEVVQADDVFEAMTLGCRAKTVAR
jgi:hypothetical protein